MIIGAVCAAIGLVIGFLLGQREGTRILRAEARRVRRLMLHK